MPRKPSKPRWSKKVGYYENAGTVAKKEKLDETQNTWLYFECYNARILPETLDAIKDFLAVDPLCDQSLNISAYPLPEFTSMHEFEQKVRADYRPLYDNDFSWRDEPNSRPLQISELFRVFAEDWQFLQPAGGGSKIAADRDFSVIISELARSDKEAKKFKKLYGGVDSIYELYLPSGETELHQIFIHCDDGNVRLYCAKDSQFWYVFHWAGS